MKPKAAVILVLILLLSGCKPEPGSLPAQTPLPETGEPGIVTVPFWHAFSPQSRAGEFIDKQINDFNSIHSEYRVLSQPLGSCASILSEIEESSDDASLPALAWVCFSAGDSLEQMVTPVSFSAILGETAAQELAAMFDPGLLQSVNDPEDMTAVPFNYSAPVIAYQTDLLSSIGLDAAFLSGSWQNFMDAAIIIQEDTGTTGLALALDPAWTMELLITTQGGQMLDENGEPAFNNRTWTEPLGILPRANEMGAASFDKSPGDAAASLRNRSVGMAVLPYEWSTDFAGNSAYAFAGWPISGAVPGELPLSGGSLYILSRDPDAQQAAAEFVLFMYENANAAEWAFESGMLPARQDALELMRNSPPDDASRAALLYEGAGSLQTEYVLPYLSIQEIFSTSLTEMMLPEYSVERALTKAMLRIMDGTNP